MGPNKNRPDPYRLLDKPSNHRKLCAPRSPRLAATEKRQHGQNIQALKSGGNASWQLTSSPHSLTNSFTQASHAPAAQQLHQHDTRLHQQTITPCICYNAIRDTHCSYCLDGSHSYFFLSDPE